MEEKAPVKKVFKKAPRKKVCMFCQEKLDVIDYKDVNRLKKFITEGGFGLPGDDMLSAGTSVHAGFNLTF